MRNYDKFLNLPHHVSSTRCPMPMRERAAQFSPFAALTGFEGVIDETARLTHGKRVLDEEQKAALDRKLAYLTGKPLSAVTVEFFYPDERKEGGEYRIYTGQLKKSDGVTRKLVFTDGTQIPIDDVVEITSSLFDELEGEA